MVSRFSVVIFKLQNVGKGWDSNPDLPLQNHVILPTVPWEPLEWNFWQRWVRALKNLTRQRLEPGLTAWEHCCPSHTAVIHVWIKRVGNFGLKRKKEKRPYWMNNSCLLNWRPKITTNTDYFNEKMQRNRRRPGARERPSLSIITGTATDFPICWCVTDAGFVPGHAGKNASICNNIVKQWFLNGVPRNPRDWAVQSKGSTTSQFWQQINNLSSSIPKIYFIIISIIALKTSPWLFYKTKCNLLEQVQVSFQFRYNLRT